MLLLLATLLVLAASHGLPCSYAKTVASNARRSFHGAPAPHANPNGRVHERDVRVEQPAPIAWPWPGAFWSNWTMYTSYSRDTLPPFVNGIPPPPYQAARGAVFYDYSIGAIKEEYYDFCIPIFAMIPEGNRFPCTFLNVRNVSYLRTYGSPPKAPSCCIFLKPWNPPPPNFLTFAPQSNWSISYNGTTTMNNRYVNW